MKKPAKTKPAYEDLSLLPSIIASTVCGRPYSGKEFSPSLAPGASTVAAMEAKRQAMTEDQIDEFSDLCDRFCHQVYDKGVKWFMDIVEANGNKGRDQLYVFVTHWLVAYLTNPQNLRSKIEA